MFKSSVQVKNYIKKNTATGYAVHTGDRTSGIETRFRNGNVVVSFRPTYAVVAGAKIAEQNQRNDAERDRVNAIIRNVLNNSGWVVTEGQEFEQPRWTVSES